MAAVPPLLELLENARVLRGSVVDQDRIKRLSADTLSEIGRQAAEVTYAASVTPEPGNLTHAATLALGGGAERCNNPPCRIRRIDELAQFAAFYSDKVYIDNFLADHGHHGDPGPDDTSRRRQRFVEDLNVLARVRPLIERGLIVPVTVGREFCAQCVALEMFGAQADNRFQSEFDALKARYLNEASVEVKFIPRLGWESHYVLPEELWEHGGFFTVQRKVPRELVGAPRLISQARAGKPIRLSKTRLRESNFHDSLARVVFSNVIFEMVSAQFLRTAYLSDTELPLRLLNGISGDEEVSRRNLIVQQHLTTMVPFLGHVEPSLVLRLRSREEEAFIGYRQAINAAVDSVRGEGLSLREQDARAIYSDIISPGIAKVEQAVKSARRDIFKNLGTSAGGWTAAIGFGMYSGLLPDQFLAAAQGIGLAKVAADGVKTALQLPSASDSVRKEELYFLWRVKQLAKKKTR